MKKLIILTLVSAAIFFSCKKEAKEAPENLCPVVAESAVPQAVRDSFKIRYPSTAVTTWFNKDGVAFCASFLFSGVEKLAQFANNGSFIKEEIETNQNGEHEDSTSADGKLNGGCECEQADKE
ncbi:MAG: hypothetical protein M3Y85_09250 [Bacteroidota bacterium]|nr:hypothetical protein [Bacteroidota bacterium]